MTAPDARPGARPDLEVRMLEGVVQIVCPHCDRDNRLPRDWLRSAPPCVACRNALFEGRPVLLDGERRFDKHIRYNDIPVLTLFHTVWSGESRVLQSVFDQAAAALEPRARLVSIDGAAFSDLTERLKVVRYPTLLLLYRERELARATGAMHLAQLLAWARPLITTVVTGPG
jgi:thioredoxin 2